MLYDVKLTGKTLASVLTDNPHNTFFFRYTRVTASDAHVRKGDVLAADFLRLPMRGDLVVVQHGRDTIVGVWAPPYLIDEHMIQRPVPITRDMNVMAVVSGFARRTTTCYGS